jgi:hypothetical protein
MATTLTGKSSLRVLMCLILSHFCSFTRKCGRNRMALR